MNIRNAFPVLLITAAVLASASAHADIKGNGPQMNGPVLQGPVIQGVTLQGVSLQGISIQGISIQGISIQGISIQGISLNGRAATDAKSGRFVAVTLPSGETISLR